MASTARRLVLALVAVGIAAASACTPPVASPTGTDGAPAQVLEERRIDDRLIEIRLHSPAVGPTRLRVLLPTRFDEQPDRRWPVLYLLHGGDGSYRDWTRRSDVAALTESLDLLVAMPDGGPGATYVDWAFAGPDGRPQYETYITEELPALLAAELRADGRAAVAGLSAGGFGAFSYAARHPDRYAAAASFSGNLDTRDGDEGGPWLSAVPTFALERAFPLGDPTSEEVRWRGHNPLDLVPNLAGVDLYVSAGDGRAGPLTQLGEIPDVLWLESSTARRSRRFVERATALGVPVTASFYGEGTHSWPYWNRELGRALPDIVEALGRARPRPDAFTFRSVDDRFEVWGWTFELVGRDGLAFTDVAVDGAEVRATGDGVLRVRAPDGREATLELGSTAERYHPGVDAPGPRPTGRPAVVTL